MIHIEIVEMEHNLLADALAEICQRLLTTEINFVVEIDGTVVAEIYQDLGTGRWQNPNPDL